MIHFTKNADLVERNIPFGYVEVWYPDRKDMNVSAFRALIADELNQLRQKYMEYDRKTVFGDNPYVCFFKKFKKTYPVLMQFESVMFKGRPFPEFNPVSEVAFLMEITTQVLSGAHDIDRIQGSVELYSAVSKEEFPGLRGTPFHTYPGDFCGRDDAGIIFSEIAGADERTCAHQNSTHILYPVFGTPDLDESVIRNAMDVLIRYIQVLSPDARMETGIL